MARVNHDIEPDSAGGEGSDRRPPARPGGGGGGGRRLFRGEDPLELSFPILRLGQLRIRVHWILLVYLGAELVAWLPQNRLGLPWVASAAGALVGVVILREGFRGLFARWLGSGVDHVTLWPLGGLNAASRPGTPQPAAAECGGLLAGLLLGPALAAGAVAAGVPKTSLIFNPFSIRAVVSDLSSPAQLLLWYAYYANIVMLGVNLLIPAFPMDLGRIIAARMRRHSPGSVATERAGRIGLIFSVALFVVAAISAENRLMAIAFCCFVATLFEVRRAQFIAPSRPPEPPPRIEERIEHPTKPAMLVVPDSPTELDRVLDKIAKEGLSSLSASERDVLKRETEKRRRP